MSNAPKHILLILNFLLVSSSFANPNTNNIAAVLDDGTKNESAIVLTDAKNINKVNINPVKYTNNQLPVVKTSSISTIDSKNSQDSSNVLSQQTNITQDDNVSEKLANLNQEYELAKAKQKIEQLNKKSGNGSDTPSGKTVVTGVMINEEGTKIATLRFPDGGTLDVEMGTIIKNLKVTDITLNGVTMTKNCKSRGCAGSKVFYERVYDAPQYTGTNTQIKRGINEPTSFVPYSNNTMVPPIVNSLGNNR